MILISRNLNILRILQEIICTQERDKVVINSTDGSRRIGISHFLIFHRNTLIQFICMSFVIFLIEDRCQSPVAVESQIRHAQIDIRTGSCLQSDIAFHVHTVFKGTVQVSLILITQGNRHSHLCALTGFHGQLLSLQRSTRYFVDIQSSSLKDVGFFRNCGQATAGLGFTDTFSHNIVTKIIRKLFITKVFHREAHGINALLLGIVTQLQLRGVHFLAISIKCCDVCRGLQGSKKIRKTGALLTDCVRRSIGIQRNVSSGHHQLIHHRSNFHIVISDRREVFGYILTQQQCQTCKIGTCHGGTGQSIITAAGNRRQNVSAMACDLRLDTQAGSRSPGREIRDKGSGRLIHTQLQHTATGSCQNLTVILRDGTYGQLCIANIHLDIAGNIIIDYDAGCALSFSDHRLLFKSIVTTTNEYDLTLNIHTGVISASAYAWDQNILDINFFLIAK